jgi:uncharacterized protein
MKTRKIMENRFRAVVTIDASGAVVAVKTDSFVHSEVSVASEEVVKNEQPKISKFEAEEFNPIMTAVDYISSITEYISNGNYLKGVSC